jgi:SAM-dependent methyltransferase
MSIDRRKRIAFEEVADLFDEVRPGYPDDLVEEVLDLSGIPPDGRILEIGCGPGNATLPYAQRGYHITAIELGERLAALAVRNLAGFPRVRVINSAFEAWPLEEKAFHLAISAEAMHWIPPEIGYPKVAAALHDQGSAAFYWNVAVDPQTDWSRAIDAVYRELAPQVKRTENAVTADWLTTIITDNFRASGCFGEVTVRQYAWSKRYTTDQYLKLLRTYSGHRDLDAGTKDRLFARVRAAIKQYGSVTVPNLTLLFHASVQR